LLKKRVGRKPNSVASYDAVYHLSVHSTPRLGRATLKRRYTWTCSLRGGRLAVSPLPPVGSYSTFSPLPCCQGSHSLLRCQTFADISYFKSAMPCAVRTFLITRR